MHQKWEHQEMIIIKLIKFRSKSNGYTYITSHGTGLVSPLAKIEIIKQIIARSQKLKVKPITLGWALVKFQQKMDLIHFYMQ